MGVVPKKTKAEQRIFRHINLTKIVGLIVTLMVSSQLANIMVSPKLGIPFIIFCSVIFLIMSGKSPSDPCKSFAEAWLEGLRFLMTNKTLHKHQGGEINDEEIIDAEKHE